MNPPAIVWWAVAKESMPPRNPKGKRQKCQENTNRPPNVRLVHPRFLRHLQTVKTWEHVHKCWSELERPPGFRRTGRFFPLQNRTLLKTLKMCLSQRERGSLLGLERFLLVATFSLLDSRAWRFCRIRELAMAAAISPRSRIPLGLDLSSVRVGPHDPQEKRV